MNSKADSNTTTFNAARALKAFEPFVCGSDTATLAVISTSSLAREAQTALESSAERLRFGKQGLLWIHLTANTTKEMALSPKDLRMLLIGTDPVAIVCTDSASCRALANAFSTNCQPDQVNRIWCRTVVGFESFEKMLEHSEDKQRAWALLKQL